MSSGVVAAGVVVPMVVVLGVVVPGVVVLEPSLVGMTPSLKSDSWNFQKGVSEAHTGFWEGGGGRVTVKY